ncbi:hypothetical protein B5T_02651 [Alloalcanivorax dieselolei B5]|uniref:DUF2505 domain-containing protein n=1 Tax=Alcanivorax dieselolei (strain DSM 16502 / CGMCC 1.3690 / MCCC 1A00001 / B-5) TaxID=930169 RepID=K0CH14_ALCDB|nr:DUF2505 domain-containing protein [Alloalcanivorax dieselolei]AFT70921.1 hypothetical protein B5T_02651 [Alloalcanivorax dieselolei B5]GGK01553.1 hypothetical protein GCM10007426_33290 [Alloalcanivorax dieselolei]
MEMTVERRYPVDVETLYAILTSKAFFEQRYAWGRVEDYRFDAFEQTGDGALIRIVQPIAIRADKIPGFARRFLPTRADLTTEFRWHPAPEGGYRAEYRFALGNVPVKVSGTMTLLPGSDGGGESRQITQVAVRSSVPLVGGKLEKLIGQRFDQALEGDYRATLRYIKEKTVDS